MTEWIVLLVGVIIALAIGFFLGRQKGTVPTVRMIPKILKRKTNN